MIGHFSVHSWILFLSVIVGTICNSFGKEIRVVGDSIFVDSIFCMRTDKLDVLSLKNGKGGSALESLPLDSMLHNERSIGIQLDRHSSFERLFKIAQICAQKGVEKIAYRLWNGQTANIDLQRNDQDNSIDERYINQTLYISEQLITYSVKLGYRPSLWFRWIEDEIVSYQTNEKGTRLTKPKSAFFTQSGEEILFDSTFMSLATDTISDHSKILVSLTTPQKREWTDEPLRQKPLLLSQEYRGELSLILSRFTDAPDRNRMELCAISPKLKMDVVDKVLECSISMGIDQFTLAFCVDGENCESKLSVWGE